MIEIFRTSKFLDRSFVALQILRHFIEDCWSCLKTAPSGRGAILVNPNFWSKSAEHDVTLTSLTADLFLTYDFTF